MALLESVRLWLEGVRAAERGEWGNALALFREVCNRSSCVAFNEGCAHLALGHLRDATKAFDETIFRDGHLAVGFYQRGITLFLSEHFEESLQDFEKAMNCLRGNALIDYKQLGLRFKLYACEVLQNMALVLAVLKRWDNAIKVLGRAKDTCQKHKHQTLEGALEAAKHHQQWKLLLLPPEELFQPNKKYVDQLESKDFLGKPQLVAAVQEDDHCSALEPQKPIRLATPENVKVLQEPPHRVIYHFLPREKNELEVKPGNVVFVLQQGDDGWANVRFNSNVGWETGLVPLTALQPMGCCQQEAKEHQKTGNITLLSKEPPPRPPKPDCELKKANTELKGKNLHSLFPSKWDSVAFLKDTTHALVKVHCGFTVVLRLRLDLSLPHLLTVLREKFQLPDQPLLLRYRENIEETVLEIKTNEALQQAWAQASCGHLTLWMQPNPIPLECPPQGSTRTAIALFQYNALEPGDLALRQGDKIQVLSEVTPEWLEGKVGDNVGIFPLHFVRFLDEQTGAHQELGE
uniref:NADPH oxidase activator 1 n=1 Tax=Myxine glutinosa TaxID=7769 RepID=UPI00358F7093